MFPYYIVRFKQEGEEEGEEGDDGFHTTQYDLNDKN